MNQSVYETIREYLPPYLTNGEKWSLFSQLSKFPEDQNIFTGWADNDAVQADIWTGFRLYDWDTGQPREVTAIILSNSCDLSSENRIDPGQRVMFAPLLNLSRYEALLKSVGRSQEQIGAAMGSIRRQENARIFYLPALPGKFPESIALLDNIYSQPLDAFYRCDGQRLTALNLYGFYVLLIKLSIHFTRIQEGLKRPNQ